MSYAQMLLDGSEKELQTKKEESMEINNSIRHDLATLPLSGDTPPCKMTGVTLHSHSGHLTRGCIPRPSLTLARINTTETQRPVFHRSQFASRNLPQANPLPLHANSQKGRTSQFFLKSQLSLKPGNAWRGGLDFKPRPIKLTFD